MAASIHCGDGDQEPRVDAVARVGDDLISRADFEAYLDFKRLPTRTEAEMKAALERFVERRALADAIEASGKVDPKVTQVQVEEFRKEFLISRYFDRVLNELVSDQAIAAYYDTHSAEFEQQRVHVAHILFRTRRSSTAEERVAKLTAARSAHARLDVGEEFATVAREVSEDRVSAKKGGDLGWLGPAGVDPAFAQKVLSMAQGELSEPFESSFGYHVVRILEGPRTERRPLAAVRGDIRHKLRGEAKQAETARLQKAVATQIMSVPAPRKPSKPDAVRPKGIPRPAAQRGGGAPQMAHDAGPTGDAP